MSDRMVIFLNGKDIRIKSLQLGFDPLFKVTHRTAMINILYINRHKVASNDIH